jgi:hypothetical protein
MLKHSKGEAKTGRKRKKGNATYQILTLDPIDEDKSVVEDICVWDISTSDKTGHVTVKRRTLKHHSQVSSSSPDNPSTSKEPRGDAEVACVEETEILTDIKSSSEMVNKSCQKRKRTRAKRENNSVSEFLALLALILTCFSRQGWNSGSSTIQFF